MSETSTEHQKHHGENVNTTDQPTSTEKQEKNQEQRQQEPEQKNSEQKQPQSQEPGEQKQEQQNDQKVVDSIENYDLSEQPKSLLQRLGDYAIVNKAFTTYDYIKNSSPLLNAGLSSAENATAIALAYTAPGIYPFSSFH